MARTHKGLGELDWDRAVAPPREMKPCTQQAWTHISFLRILPQQCFRVLAWQPNARCLALYPDRPPLGENVFQQRSSSLEKEAFSLRGVRF